MTDINLIFPDKLPSVLFRHYETLPIIPAIYFAIASDNSILYIGKTKYLGLRWGNHHKFQNLIDNKCERISWYSCSPDEQNKLERELIKLHNPILNITYSPNAMSNGNKRNKSMDKRRKVLAEICKELGIDGSESRLMTTLIDAFKERGHDWPHIILEMIEKQSRLKHGSATDKAPRKPGRWAHKQQAEQEMKP